MGLAVLHASEKCSVTNLATDMNGLVLMDADPALTFGEIREPMNYHFQHSQKQAVGDQEYNTAVHQSMCCEPVISNWKQTVLFVMNLVIVILAIPHRFRLQHKICQCVTEDEQEQVFKKQHRVTSNRTFSELILLTKSTVRTVSVTDLLADSHRECRCYPGFIPIHGRCFLSA